MSWLGRPSVGAPWCRAYPRGCGGTGWPALLGLAFVVFARGGAAGVGCFCGQVCGGDAGVGPVVVEAPREELAGLGPMWNSLVSANGSLWPGASNQPGPAATDQRGS